jgi:hypothetical protein
VNGSLTSNTESATQPSKPLTPLAHHELLLNRNRQAAKRCRQKRKLQNQQDESILKKQATRKKELLADTKRLQYEVLYLRFQILKHSQCKGYIKRYVEQMTGRVLREDTASDVQQATTVVSSNNKEKELCHSRQQCLTILTSQGRRIERLSMLGCSLYIRNSIMGWFLTLGD